MLNIYNQFPENFVRAGDTTVNVPEQPAPVTNVTLPETTVTIADGAIRATVEAPPPAQVTVNVPAQEPPTVNIAEGAIRATVEAPPPAEVNVYVPEQEPPSVTVEVPSVKPMRKVVTRNDAGQVTETRDEVIDDG